MLLSGLSALKYPQNIWVRELDRILDETGLLESTDHIYDMPGGIGLVAHGLSKRINAKFSVIDIDKKKIAFGARFFGGRDVSYHASDIKDVRIEKPSIWFIVNSFFLLDGLKEFLKVNGSNIPYIVGVFPHTNSENYLFFKEHIDSDLNCNEMTRAETIAFFSDNGFDLSYQSNVIRFNFLRFARLPLIGHLIGVCFGILESVFPLKGRCYWIGVFRRASSEDSPKRV